MIADGVAFRWTRAPKHLDIGESVSAWLDHKKNIKEALQAEVENSSTEWFGFGPSED